MTVCRQLLIAALATGTVGCRTAPTEHEKAARIVNPDDASRAALQRAVKQALNTHVMLADDALTKSSLLVIEHNPPRTMQNLPTQGRNMEEPFQFRLVINGADCILIDQRDRSRYLLENTTCEAE